MKTIRYRALALAPLLAVLACSAPAQAPLPTEAQERAEQGEPGNAARDEQRKYFAQLDTGQKGYLSQDDASGDPILTQNWTRCDVNHDGKLTLQEYLDCTKPRQR
jgi:hypothetical protein